MNKIYFLLLNLSVFSAIAQQIPDSIATGERLMEVRISSFHINDSLMNAPASIVILSSADLHRNSGMDISTSMNTVAGVLMQSGNYNTNRISIRGIGARTPYGTNKIRAFYGNIPLTSGDSETTIEDIDVENIQQIEIIKGPLSSLYGAGLGGAILISPKLSGPPGQMASFSSTHGSFGLVKNNISYGLNQKSGSLNVSYHSLKADGWRENSAYDREGVTIAGELLRKQHSKLTYFGNYTFMKAFIPSSIDFETFTNNPQAAAFTWNAAQGYEQYDSYLSGLSYEFRIGNFSNVTSVFINSRDSNEPRPFDVLNQQTMAYGARTQFSLEFNKKALSKIIVGLEYFRDDFDAQTFENLYEDNNGNGSLQGSQLSGTTQNRTFYNAFSQLRVQISPKFELQAGLNMNATKFTLERIFPSDNAVVEKYQYDLIWAPQLSLLYKPNQLATIYMSASRGFSLPGIEETLTPEGTINPNIRPETGYNFELGTKLFRLNRSLYVEASLFRMLITDLLVAQRIGDDQYVGVNAGETLHQGAEVYAKYEFGLGAFTVRPFAAISIGQYEFKEFNHNGTDFSGNELTGVPKNTVSTGININMDSGWYLGANYNYVDRIPLNDANDVYTDSYRILNLKLGLTRQLLRGLHFDVAAGINNALNEHYAAMILPNATGFGNAQPRFYYPGLPDNYYGQISIRYIF